MIFLVSANIRSHFKALFKIVSDSYSSFIQSYLVQIKFKPNMFFCSLHPLIHPSMPGLSTCHFAWAFHSEAEEELLNMIPAMQRGDPQWSELRAVGVGWWIRNINTLRKMVEKVPKNAFCKSRRKF